MRCNQLTKLEITIDQAALKVNACKNEFIDLMEIPNLTHLKITMKGEFNNYLAPDLTEERGYSTSLMEFVLEELHAGAFDFEFLLRLMPNLRQMKYQANYRSASFNTWAMVRCLVEHNEMVEEMEMPGVAATSEGALMMHPGILPRLRVLDIKMMESHNEVPLLNFIQDHNTLHEVAFTSECALMAILDTKLTRDVAEQTNVQVIRFRGSPNFTQRGLASLERFTPLREFMVIDETVDFSRGYGVIVNICWWSSHDFHVAVEDTSEEDEGNNEDEAMEINV